MKPKRMSKFDWILYAIMLGITFLSVAPLLHEVAISFSAALPAASGTVSIWPIGWNLHAYDKVMHDHQFFISFILSIERVLAEVSLSVVITVLMAYPLSRETKHFSYRNVYMWLLIFTMMFSGGLIPGYLAIRSYGLIDTFWVLVLPSAANVFNAILVFNFFRHLPKEIDDSSSVDGAGPWRKLISIYVPMSLPVLATIVLFKAVGTWNDYFTGMIYISDSRLIPLQTYLQNVVLNIDPNQLLANMNPDQMKMLSNLTSQTLAAAKIVVAMVPILVIYPFLQRYFIHGITLGSVKE